MELKLDKKKVRKIKKGEMIPFLIGFWNRKYKIFLGMVLIAALALGGFIWYQSLYTSAWSEQERESYRMTKDTGINFREKDFSKAMQIVDDRSVEYQNEQLKRRDIFRKN